METFNIENTNLKNGFIPLSRSLFQHPFWKQKRVFSYAEAWIDLIQKARFDRESGSCMIKNELVTFQRGELVMSQRILSENWGWSTCKLRYFLSVLRDESMITVRHTKVTRTMIITICNYEKYNFISQSEEDKKKRKKNADKTRTTHQQPNTNKENKENKEINCVSDPHTQSEDYKKFTGWMIENTPFCVNPVNFPKGITEKQFLKLKLQYSGTQIADTLLRLENRKDLRKRYNNLYLTILNWLKRDYGNN